jgi:hypothetical protein
MSFENSMSNLSLSKPTEDLESLGNSSIKVPKEFRSSQVNSIISPEELGESDVNRVSSPKESVVESLGDNSIDCVSEWTDIPVDLFETFKKSANFGNDESQNKQIVDFLLKGNDPCSEEAIKKNVLDFQSTSTSTCQKPAMTNLKYLFMNKKKQM